MKHFGNALCVSLFISPWTFSNSSREVKDKWEGIYPSFSKLRQLLSSARFLGLVSVRLRAFWRRSGSTCPAFLRLVILPHGAVCALATTKVPANGCQARRAKAAPIYVNSSLRRPTQRREPI